MNEFSLAALTLVGWVFAASATGKLSSRQAYRLFRGGLGEARLIPARMLAAAAVSLACTETLVSGGLLTATGLTAATVPGAAVLADWASGAAALLTAVLTIGVGVVIRHGTQARCACFGARSSRPLGRAHLVRNMSLLAIVCAGLAASVLAHGRPPLAGSVLAVTSGTAAALLFVRWDDLAELFGSAPASAPAVPTAPAAQALPARLAPPTSRRDS
jgi:hypothetical protein